MKKALLTFGIGKCAPELQYTLPTFDRYAQTHGYELIVGKEEQLKSLCGDRPESWLKILLFLQHLDTYDVMVWLDSDVFIVDHSKDILDSVPKDVFQAFSTHTTEVGTVINCGVWVLRSPSSYKALLKQYLQDIWKQREYISHAWWEQAAVLHLLGVDPNARPVTTDFSSLYGEWTYLLGPEWNWHRKDKSYSNAPKFLHATTFSERLDALRSWSLACSRPLE